MKNNFQIDSAAVSDRGLSEKRPQNEDSFLEMNNSGLFAVADGVGGAQAGDVASQMAMEILGEAFANLSANRDAEDVMRIAIERANEAIFQMSRDIPQFSTMATTVVALHVDGNIATIGHVGDSRLYRLDKKGSLYRETQDHSVVEEEVRAGRMTIAQAATHPSRNVISRALGADSTVEVDMKTIMFEPQTTFLLCSDGVTRHIDDFELRDLLLSGENPSRIVQKIKEVCYERGAEDNLTAVVARVSEAVAESGSNLPFNPSGEIEEATTAVSARAASAKQPIFSEPAFGAEEISTADFATPAKKKPAAETSLQNEVLADADNGNKNAAFAPIENVETAPVPAREPVVEKTRRVEKVKEKSPLGKILSPLLALLLGGIIGAGIYHAWAQRNLEPDTPQLPPPQTQNIPLTAFEEARRTVDKNPERYISASNSIAETPEDYYLLGRAYLLTGRFPEAKQAFTEARSRLAQVDNVNEDILANEILMGLAIVNDPFAQKEFQQEAIADRYDANAPINVNANLSNRSQTPNSNIFQMRR